MQYVTYGFFGLVGVIIVGYIFFKIASAKNGKKLVEKGMEGLQKKNFSAAYNCFVPALKLTVGTADYSLAVKGLAKAYQMSGASADVGQLMQYGRDVQKAMNDPRVDKAKRKVLMQEVNERIDRAVRDLPQL